MSYILSIQELYTGAKRIISLVSETFAGNETVSSIIAAIEPVLEGIEDGLSRQRASEFTPALASKDSNRDARFILLRDFIAASTKIDEDPTKHGAAIILYGIFEETGKNLHRLGYANETAQLNALINRLEEQDATDALATLEATQYFAELKASQRGFEALYEEKVNTEANRDYPQLRQSQQALAGYLRLLLININFLAEQSPETYEPLVEELNMIIVELNTRAKARETREENEQVEETESSQNDDL